MKKQTIIALANSIPIAFIALIFIAIGVGYNNEYCFIGGLLLLALAIIGGIGLYIYYSSPERLRKLKINLVSFALTLILLSNPVAFAAIPSMIIQNKELPQKINITLPELIEESYNLTSQNSSPYITFKFSNNDTLPEPTQASHFKASETISVEKFKPMEITATTVSEILLVHKETIFILWVEVNNVTDFYSWTYELQWNSSVLELQGIIEGPFLPTWNFNSSITVPTILWFDVAHYTPGNLKGLVGARLGDMIGSDGSGIIAGFKFKAIEEGYTTLSFFNGAWSTPSFKVSTLPSAEIGVLVYTMIKEVKIRGTNFVVNPAFAFDTFGWTLTGGAQLTDEVSLIGGKSVALYPPLSGVGQCFYPSRYADEVRVECLVYAPVAGQKLAITLTYDGGSTTRNYILPAGWSTVCFDPLSWHSKVTSVYITISSSNAQPVYLDYVDAYHCRNFERSGYLELWLTIFWPFQQTQLSICVETTDSSGRLIGWVGLRSSGWVFGNSKCMFGVHLPTWASIGTAQLRVELWTDWKWKNGAEMYESCAIQFEIAR